MAADREDIRKFVAGFLDLAERRLPEDLADVCIGGLLDAVTGCGVDGAATISDELSGVMRRREAAAKRATDGQPPHWSVLGGASL